MVTNQIFSRYFNCHALFYILVSPSVLLLLRFENVDLSVSMVGDYGDHDVAVTSVTPEQTGADNVTGDMATILRYEDTSRAPDMGQRQGFDEPQ